MNTDMNEQAFDACSSERVVDLCMENGVALQYIQEQDYNDELVQLEMMAFQFQSMTLTPVWRYLKESGWTYDAIRATYHSPNLQDPEGNMQSRCISFSSAAKVLKFLDEPSLTEVHSNLQSTIMPVHGPNLDNTPSEQNTARDLRRRLLTEIFKSEENRNKTDTIENTEQDSARATQAQRLAQLRRGSSPSESLTAPEKRGAVTAVEKGTEMYLYRNSRRRRKSKQSKNVSEVRNTQSSMTLEESIDFVESILEQDATSERGVFSSDDQDASLHEVFSEWRFVLSTNHSLLIFGSGSKRTLLSQFANEELSKEGHILLIDGFDEHATMDGILSLLVQLFLDNQEPVDLAPAPKEDEGDEAVLGRSTPYRAHPLVERAIAIGRAIALTICKADEKGDIMDEVEGTGLPIYIVIHNLDAPNFANTVAQDALAELLVNSTVSNYVASLRLVASVDQIDATVHLWSIATAANFSWIFKSFHTRRPYVHELVTLSEEEHKRRKTSTLSETLETVQADRVVEVLRNLAPRHAEVVQILAKLQLLEEKKKSAWVSYQTYFTHCQRACSVGKDSQLRHFLSELNDHGLVASKMEGSSEYVQIPYNETKLREILAYNGKG